MIREGEGLYATLKHVYAETKCRGAYVQGGVIAGFYDNIKGYIYPQDNIRVTV